MLSAMILGAEGVQVGSRFAVSAESSAHENFKNKVLNLGEGDTILTLKKLTPVRMIKNKFFEQVKEAEENCSSAEELSILLGRGRSKRGMFEGDLDEGELEIGQVSSIIDTVLPASDIMQNLISEYKSAIKDLNTNPLYQFGINDII
jgi:enoyl-[acyl-carrier protein] reductase II